MAILQRGVRGGLPAEAEGEVQQRAEQQGQWGVGWGAERWQAGEKRAVWRGLLKPVPFFLQCVALCEMHVESAEETPLYTVPPASPQVWEKACGGVCLVTIRPARECGEPGGHGGEGEGRARAILMSFLLEEERMGYGKLWGRSWAGDRWCCCVC